MRKIFTVLLVFRQNTFNLGTLAMIPERTAIRSCQRMLRRNYRPWSLKGKQFEYSANGSLCLCIYHQTIFVLPVIFFGPQFCLVGITQQLRNFKWRMSVNVSTLCWSQWLRTLTWMELLKLADVGCSSLFSWHLRILKCWRPMKFFMDLILRTEIFLSLMKSPLASEWRPLTVCHVQLSVLSMMISLIQLN